jgi:hypothetical protein
MATQLQLRPFPRHLPAAIRLDVPPIAAPLLGRLVHIGLAVCLLPALLAVVVASAFGLLVLQAGRFMSVGRYVCKPEHSAGLEVFRS